MKLCCNCKEFKNKSEFYKDRQKSDGLTSRCKNCINVADKESYKGRKETKRIYYLKNKISIINRLREYKKNRRKDDIGYHISCNLRRRLSHAIKGNLKADKTLNLLGCSKTDLIFHLQSKFTSGMA